MITHMPDQADLYTGNGTMPEVSDSSIKNMVQVFKLLSDETRLRILFYLSQRDELHVRALCELLQQSQPAVSHHLALLRVAGLIEPRREGKHNFYRLLPGRFDKVFQMLFAVMANGNHQIRFDDYVLTYEPHEDETASL